MAQIFFIAILYIKNSIPDRVKIAIIVTSEQSRRVVSAEAFSSPFFSFMVPKIRAAT